MGSSEPKREDRETAPEASKGNDGRGGRTPDSRALEVGGGAAAGALVGRFLLGGTLGVVIGAALGAIAGSAVSAETRRRSAETRRRPAASGRRAAEAARPASATPGKPASGKPTGTGKPAETRTPTPSPAREEPLERWTKARLYQRARELDIAGRSGMSKTELIRALRRHPDFSTA